jgi:poly-gamma-glutamate synthase PgsB/CapB
LFAAGRVLTVLLSTLALFLLYLLYERTALRRIRRFIPTVVTVTGTRGKSSVVRMLASILREGGFKVVAKTTGSEAQFVIPDGSVQDVRRRGMPSVLEQKKALRTAAKLGADYLIAEIMSIRPENHIVESCQILKPDIVLFTNVRRDHVDAMGQTEEEIARVLRLDIPRAAKVYVSEKYRGSVEDGNEGSPSHRVVSVQPGLSDSLLQKTPELGKLEFGENLDLVVALARDLKFDEETIARGVLNTSYDLGKFRIWMYRDGGKEIFLANAFAANDPESTMKVLEKTREVLAPRIAGMTGVLSLRPDRGDRTLQWIRSLRNGMAEHFRKIYVTGDGAEVLRRRVKGVEILRSREPERTTNHIAATMEEGEVLFGFGNIVGAGRALVEYWKEVGQDYGL